MFNSGFVESDLSGVKIFGQSIEKNSKDLPSIFNLDSYIDEPHDQGSRGICVSVCVYDMCKFLSRGTGKPWVRTLDYFYNCRKNTKIDGMSPREALEIAQRDKLISSYALLKNSLAIQYSILANGPTMLCLPVYDSSKTNFWEYTGGSVEGYHAITVVGYNPNGFILRNSWGLSYGNGGYSQFPYTAFGKIIEAWTIFS